LYFRSFNKEKMQNKEEFYNALVKSRVAPAIRKSTLTNFQNNSRGLTSYNSLNTSIEKNEEKIKEAMDRLSKIDKKRETKFERLRQESEQKKIRFNLKLQDQEENLKRIQRISVFLSKFSYSFLGNRKEKERNC